MDLHYSECEKHPDIYWHTITYGEKCPLCKMELQIEELEIQAMVDDERLKIVLDLKDDDYINKMKEFAKQCETDPELAKEFLQKTGIYTEDRELTENYK